MHQRAEAPRGVHECGAHQRGVRPPQREVRGLHAADGCSGPADGLCDDPARRRPARPVRVIQHARRLHLRGGHAEGLEREARHRHGEQQPEEHVVLEHRVEPRRSDDPAPVSRHGDARDEHEPADVPHELPLDAHVRRRQPPTKVALDVELDGGDGRRDEQDEHSPEDEEMHEAGVSLAPDEPAVRRRVNQEGLGPGEEPLAPTADVGVRRAEPPDTRPPVERPRHGGEGHEAPSYRRRRPAGTLCSRSRPVRRATPSSARRPPSAAAAPEGAGECSAYPAPGQGASALLRACSAAGVAPRG